MNKKTITLACALAILTAAVANAASMPAMSSNASQMASLRALSGTWSCMLTFRSAGKSVSASESETFAPYGTGWMHGIATISRSGHPVSRQDSYWGYNARHGHWVVITLDASSNYQVETSSSASLNGSAWTVVYPGRMHAMSTLRIMGGKYTVSSSWTSPRSGKSVSSSEVCSK